MSVLYTLYTTTYSSAKVILSGFKVVMTRGLIPIRRERNGAAAAAGPEARRTNAVRPERTITATSETAISRCRQTRSTRYSASSPTITNPHRHTHGATHSVLRCDEIRRILYNVSPEARIGTFMGTGESLADLGDGPARHTPIGSARVRTAGGSSAPPPPCPKSRTSSNRRTAARPRPRPSLLRQSGSRTGRPPGRPRRTAGSPRARG